MPSSFSSSQIARNSNVLLSLMYQPPFDMENCHNIINMPTMNNNMQMIPFDENDPEVIARRIKNRERQRRYRARKRQEADMKRTCAISQTVQPQVPETLVNNFPMEIVTTRVYSQRNWKKDARRAHLVRQQEQEQQQNASSSTSTSIDLKNSINQSNLVDTRELSSTPSGRNWKAEARNKRK